MRKPTGASGIEIAIALLLAVVLTLIVLVVSVDTALPASGMMGVGRMMGPDDGGSGPPPETFYLTNDAGDILTDDTGADRITTQ